MEQSQYHGHWMCAVGAVFGFIAGVLVCDLSPAQSRYDDNYFQQQSNMEMQRLDNLRQQRDIEQQQYEQRRFKQPC